MTYEQLVVLHAIVTEGTFRGAAEKLNKSQSAVSHMLKKLETEIDIVLLSREEYRPTLTPAGDVFYRQAMRVMQQMQQLGSIAKNLSSTQEAEVFLAVTATYPLKDLLKIIGEVTAEYPATHIKLSGEAMGGSVERLMNDQADIIIASMDGVPADQVEAIPFAQVTIMPVAHPDFEPAQSSHLKTISEMQSYTQIVVADSSSGAFSQSRDLLPGGLRWTVSDFMAKKEILLANMGWGGIPTHMIEDELASGELVPLNVEGYQPRQSHLFQIRKRDKDIGIVAQNIWEKLQECH
ncbi:LysR family transcriptional regulator [Lentilitoribacter sp. Alg239-R112]|uniref:LysR family transcriptional regulator n=1 Tax=Lentilitoribacter sp. Alg239-R112 TaxID=2305987 RepID=UPI0013A6B6BD|nr:LysR family transcriptional regulator [Lentilitoribacter sp. Alg239-R112]